MLRALIGLAAPLLIPAAPPGEERVRFVLDGDTFILTGGERIRATPRGADRRQW